jgi:hypothetical protein
LLVPAAAAPRAPPAAGPWPDSVHPSSSGPTPLASVDGGVVVAAGEADVIPALPRHWQEQLEKAPLGRRRVMQR